MEVKYVRRGRIRLPLGVQIALSIMYGFSSLLDVTEKVAEMSNYGSIRKQEILTREYEDKIKRACEKYMVGGERLEDFVGGVDGKI